MARQDACKGRRGTGEGYARCILGLVVPDPFVTRTDVQAAFMYIGNKESRRGWATETALGTRPRNAIGLLLLKGSMTCVACVLLG